jgi:hypothetical protein
VVELVPVVELVETPGGRAWAPLSLSKGRDPARVDRLCTSVGGMVLTIGMEDSFELGTVVTLPADLAWPRQSCQWQGV